MSDLLLTAAIRKYRWDTSKGQLNVEQLCDLSLQSSSATTVTLDGIAKDLNRQVKALAEESFVTPRVASPENELIQKLEIVKMIIAVKLEEQALAKTVRERAEKKKQLTELLAQKDEEGLKALTKEELLKQIAELG